MQRPRFRFTDNYRAAQVLLSHRGAGSYSAGAILTGLPGTLSQQDLLSSRISRTLPGVTPAQMLWLAGPIWRLDKGGPVGIQKRKMGCSLRASHFKNQQVEQLS